MSWSAFLNGVADGLVSAAVEVAGEAIVSACGAAAASPPQLMRLGRASGLGIGSVEQGQIVFHFSTAFGQPFRPVSMSMKDDDVMFLCVSWLDVGNGRVNADVLACILQFNHCRATAGRWGLSPCDDGSLLLVSQHREALGLLSPERVREVCCTMAIEAEELDRGFRTMRVL